VRVVVQKFGGSSLSTAELRREAMQRVWDAVDRGFTPVVVVSAMDVSVTPMPRTPCWSW